MHHQSRLSSTKIWMAVLKDGIYRLINLKSFYSQDLKAVVFSKLAI